MGGRGSAGKSGEGGSSKSNNSVVRNYKDISLDEAEALFDAPKGTQIRLKTHSQGDYIGELTKTDTGWVGSQKYRSSYAKPQNATTSKGFVMRVGGKDVEIV